MCAIDEKTLEWILDNLENEKVEARDDLCGIEVIHDPVAGGPVILNSKTRDVIADFPLKKGKGQEGDPKLFAKEITDSFYVSAARRMGVTVWRLNDSLYLTPLAWSGHVTSRYLTLSAPSMRGVLSCSRSGRVGDSIVAYSSKSGTVTVISGGVSAIFPMSITGVFDLGVEIIDSFAHLNREEALAALTPEHRERYIMKGGNR